MSEQIEKVARAIYIADSIDETAGADEWDTGKVCAHMVGNYFTLARAAIAALDGAPEPEWEYQGRTDYGRVVAQGSLDEVGFLSEHLFWERRRPAGEWLPVEGEKP